MPEATDFSFDEAEFTTAISGLRASHDELWTAINSLESQLTEILGRWRGPAKMAYEAAKTEWRNSAQNITNALNAAQLSAGQTLDTYLDMESNNTRIWG